ncbi:hypothetical protein U1Q18_012874 [Sarracenia purpurea var. burkii]
MFAISGKGMSPSEFVPSSTSSMSTVRSCDPLTSETALSFFNFDPMKDGTNFFAHRLHEPFSVDGTYESAISLSYLRFAKILDLFAFTYATRFLAISASFSHALPILFPEC